MRIYHELPDDEDNDNLETTLRAMNKTAEIMRDNPPPVPRHSKQVHYIAMGGLHGYLPSHCNVYDTEEEAIASLVDFYELGKKRARVLRRDLSLELNPKRDGNEYIEITECDCDTPEVHNDV
jgi:hypothetical protein